MNLATTVDRHTTKYECRTERTPVVGLVRSLAGPRWRPRRRQSSARLGWPEPHTGLIEAVGSVPIPPPWFRATQAPSIATAPVVLVATHVVVPICAEGENWRASDCRSRRSRFGPSVRHFGMSDPSSRSAGVPANVAHPASIPRASQFARRPLRPNPLFLEDLNSSKRPGWVLSEMVGKRSQVRLAHDGFVLADRTDRPNGSRTQLAAYCVGRPHSALPTIG
jgi:hypothetical protein